MLKMKVKFKSGKEEIHTFYHFDKVQEEFFRKVEQGIIVDYDVIG